MKRKIFLAIFALGLAVSPVAEAQETQLARLPEGTLYYSASPEGQGRAAYNMCTGTATLPSSETEVPPEVLSLTSDNATQVTDNDLYEFWDVVWSPSNDRFAVSGAPDPSYDQCRAYVITVDDGAAYPISRDDEFECSRILDWSEDGTWILMRVDYYSHGTQLYKVRPDGSGLQALSGSIEGVHISGAEFVDQGQAVVYWGDTEDGRGIFVISLTGRHLTTLVRLKDRGPEQSFIETASVAPNGRRVAYSVHDGDEGFSPGDGVFMVRIDGTNKRRIMSGRRDRTALSWGPGSRRLAVVSGSMYRTDGPISIKIIRRDSEAVTRVDIPSNGRIYRWDPPLWSASGDHLAFRVDDPQRGGAAFVAHSRTGRIAQVTEFDYPFELFSWRP